ncbi:MAG: hypothetical protein Q7T87_18925 [Polaromonas sp.]|nr:hypothetical protein [Polaromonas sp.]
MNSMPRIAALLFGLAALLITAPDAANAQGAEHDKWIRQSARSALDTFLAGGAPALQRQVEACYRQSELKPDAKAFFKEAEGCTAQDQLGLLAYSAEVRRQQKQGTVSEQKDAFFHLFAHRARVEKFWVSRRMNAANQKKMTDTIMAIVYDEFTRQLAVIARQPLPDAAAGAASGPNPSGLKPPAQ